MSFWAVRMGVGVGGGERGCNGDSVFSGGITGTKVAHLRGGFDEMFLTDASTALLVFRWWKTSASESSR
jgi:hypothetical protein